MASADHETPNTTGRRLVSRETVWAAAGLIIIFTLVAAIRWRLLDRPLERDEGEYAYAGQLMWQGVPPYVLAYNMKWPGTYAAYAGIMAVFGQTASGIHAGLIIVNLLTAFFVFLIARRMLGALGSVAAAATYAVLSVSPATVGLAAHATHFVVLPAIVGIFLIQRPEDHASKWRIFVAGALFGIATVTKQSGAVFGVFGALWILASAPSEKTANTGWPVAKRIGWLASGGLAPLALTGWLLFHAGVFGRFWQWTVLYAGAYAGNTRFSAAWGNLGTALRSLWTYDPGLWALAIIGFAALFLDKALRAWRFFMLLLALCSALAVCPGWYFRGHYFIQALPAAALLAGAAVEAAARQFERWHFGEASSCAAIALICAALIYSFCRARNVYFLLTPRQTCAVAYGENPFPEATEISRFLETNCPPDGTIALLGSEPEIYFYSHRRSATGYIYTYPLMEVQPFALSMQEEMIREIEKAGPQYIVFVRVVSSWNAHDESQFLIMHWFDKYRDENLQLVGLVDIVSRWEAEYHWLRPGDAEPTPKSEFYVKIYRNRSAAGAPVILPAGIASGRVAR